MSLDWYPAIRECCIYWRDAPMLQQTFDALEKSFSTDNDACIDSAKCIVEVVCQIIIGELDSPAFQIKPKEENPAFGVWVSAAVRALKLGDVRNAAFQKLISQHHRLTTTLGDLRNDAGPVSHGKDGFIEKLSVYHRRAAVLSADAIVAFLHQAYRETELNLVRTREPYERFASQNEMIDKWCGYAAAEIDDDGLLSVTVALPGDVDSLVIDAAPSQFLFQLDRAAYIEALNAARSAEAFEETSEETAA
jgi:Abortive infection C-terminus